MGLLKVRDTMTACKVGKGGTASGGLGEAEVPGTQNMVLPSSALISTRQERLRAILRVIFVLFLDPDKEQDRYQLGDYINVGRSTDWGGNSASGKAEVWSKENSLGSYELVGNTLGTGEAGKNPPKKEPIHWKQKEEGV